MHTQFYAGEGSGRLYSITPKVDNAPEIATKFGTSQEEIGVNVVNGELSVVTEDLVLPAPGLANTLLRVYKGQREGWVVGAIPRINVKPNSTSDPTFIYYEHADGSLSQFVYESETKKYVCTWPEYGVVHLSKQDTGDWKLDIVKSGITEIFNGSGVLQQRTTWDGGKLEYVPDAQGRLEKIIDSTEQALTFVYEGLKTSVSYQGKPLVNYRYETYAQNKLRLKQCIHILADGSEYAINFSYEGNNAALSEILQDDNTGLEIRYQNNRVTEVFYAEPETIAKELDFEMVEETDETESSSPKKISCWKIDYKTQQSTVVTPESVQHVYGIGQDKNLTFYKVLDPTHPDASGITQTYAQYNQTKQPEIITLNDGSSWHYQYTHGLLTAATFKDADNQTLLEILTPRDKQGQVISKTITNDKKESTCEYFFYDPGVPQRLIFSIDTRGYVTAYDHYPNGKVKTSTEYFIAYPTETADAMTLDKLSVWCAGQNPAYIKATEYTYHENGCLKSLTINPEQDNISTTYAVDLLGHNTQVTEPQQLNGEIPTTTAQYDYLRRIREQVDAEGKQHTYNYVRANKGMEENHILPNGRLEKITRNAGGNIQQSNIADNAAPGKSLRTSEMHYNADAYPLFTINAFKQREIVLHDGLGRLIGQINAAGYLSYYYLDKNGNVAHKVNYEQPKPELLTTEEPTQATVLAAIKKWQETEPNPRGSYHYFNAFNQEEVTIQENGAVTVREYGLHGQTLVRQYFQPVDTKKPLPLELKEIRNQLPTHAQDRQTRYFYKANGELYGVLKPNGSLSETHQYHKGLFEVTLEYKTPVLQQDFDKSCAELRPVPTAADRKTIILRNTLGQKIAEIDGENYLTEYEYDKAGDMVKSIRYFQRVSVPNSEPFVLADITKHRHSEDAVTTLEYNKNHLPTKIHYPSGKIEEIEYTANNLEQSRCGFTEKPLEHDKQQYRGQAQVYNIFDEITSRISPLGMQAWRNRHLNSDWKNYVAHSIINELGQVIETSDECGNRTFYCYDARGLQQFIVNPEGKITENIHDAYSNPHKIIQYQHRLSVDEITLLLAKEPRSAATERLAQFVKQDVIKNDSKNREQFNLFDQLDNIVYTEEVNGKRSWCEYNVFGEMAFSAEDIDANRVVLQQYVYIFNAQGKAVEIRQFAINNADPKRKEDWLTDFVKQFDPTKHPADKQRLLKRIQYDAWERVIEETDALGVVSYTDHDKLDRNSAQGTLIAGNKSPLQTTVWDAHDRKEQIIQADKTETNFTHNSALRTTTQTFMGDDTQIILKKNVFAETVETLRGKQKIFTVRNPQGNIEEERDKQDEQGLRSKTEYDTKGRPRNSTTPQKNTHYDYTATDKVETSTTTTPYATYTDRAELDIFDEPEESKLQMFRSFPTDLSAIEARSVQHKHEIKANSQTDIDSEKKTTVTIQNLAGDVESEQITDTQGKIVHKSRMLLDDYGQVVATVIDPEGLQIKEESLLAADGNLYAVIEHNKEGSRTTYTLSCLSGLAKLKINARGFATYTEYNSNRQITRSIELAMPFSSAEITDVVLKRLYIYKIADIIAQRLSSAENINTQYLYTPTGLLRYAINPLGIVRECIYDSSGFKVHEIEYTNSIEPAKIGSYTLSSISSDLIPSAQDRCTQYINDHRGNPLFTISYADLHTAYLVSKQFDADGNCYAEIKFAKPISLVNQPLLNLNWDLAQAENWVAANSNDAADQRSIFYYAANPDPQGKPLLLYRIINGVFTKLDYNLEGKLQRETQFTQILPMAKIRELCAANKIENYNQFYQEASTKDPYRKHVKEYDVLGNLYKETDPEGNIITYEPDVIGQVQSIIDRNQQKTGYVVDQAGRNYQEISPIREVAEVTEDSNLHTLSLKLNKKSLVKTFEHNESGEVTKITEGDESLKRETEFTHDLNGNVKTKTVKNVPVYNAKNEESTKIDLVTTYFYDWVDRPYDNQTNHPIKIIHPDKTTEYFIFNKLGKLAFTIGKNKALVQYVYDAHGDIVQKVEFAVPLVFNDDQYAQGMTIEQLSRIKHLDARFLQGIITFSPKSVERDDLVEEDRVSYTLRDRLGRNTSELKRKDIFYSPEAEDKGKHFFSMEPRIDREYDAFNNEIYTCQILNPYTGKKAENFYYYDQYNNKVAHIDPRGYLTEYKYNAQNLCEEKIEYSTALKGPFDKNVKPRAPTAVEADQHTSYLYNKNGVRIYEIIRDHHYYTYQAAEPVPILHPEKKTAERRQFKLLDGEGREIVNAVYTIDGAKTPTLLSIQITLRTSDGLPWCSLGTPISNSIAQPEKAEYIPIEFTYYDALQTAAATRRCEHSISLTNYSAVVESLTKAFIDPSRGNINGLLQLAEQVTAGVEISTLDFVTLTKADVLGRPQIVQEPSGLRRDLDWPTQGDNYARERITDTQPSKQQNAEHTLYESVTITTTQASDSLGQVIQKNISSTTGEKSAEFTEYNTFGEVAGRHDGKNPGEFIRYNRQGLPSCSNSNNGANERYFYTPDRYRSLTASSAKYDVTDPQYADPHTLANIPVENLQLEKKLYDTAGNVLSHQLPAYYEYQQAPEVALQVEVDPESGLYMITFARPANSAVTAEFYLRVYGLASEATLQTTWQRWQKYGVTIDPKNSQKMRVIISANAAVHLPTDLYEYRIVLFMPTRDNPRVPYSEGYGPIAIDTPNKQGSKHVIFTSAGPTTIQVSGNTQSDPPNGLQLIQNNVVAKAVGLTPQANGTFLGDASGAARGRYFSRRAKIGLHIGDPFTIYSTRRSLIDAPPLVLEVDLQSSIKISFYKEIGRVKVKDEETQQEIELEYAKHWIGVVVIAGDQHFNSTPTKGTIELQSKSGRTFILPINFVESSIEVMQELQEYRTVDRNNPEIWDKTLEAPATMLDKTGQPIVVTQDSLDYPTKVNRLIIDGQLKYTANSKQKRANEQPAYYELFDKPDVVAEVQPNAVYLSDRTDNQTKTLSLSAKTANTSMNSQRQLFMPLDAIKQHIQKSKKSNKENREASAGDQPCVVQMKTSAGIKELSLTYSEDEEFMTVDLSSLGTHTVNEIQLLGEYPLDNPNPHPAPDYKTSPYYVDTRRGMTDPIEPPPEVNPIVDSYLANLRVTFVQELYRPGQFSSTYTLYISNLEALPSSWRSSGAYRVVVNAWASNRNVPDTKDIPFYINLFSGVGQYVYASSFGTYHASAVTIYRDGPDGITSIIYQSTMVGNKFCDGYIEINPVDGIYPSSTWSDRPERTKYYLRPQTPFTQVASVQISDKYSGRVISNMVPLMGPGAYQHNWIDLTGYPDPNTLSFQLLGAEYNNKFPVQPLEVEVRSAHKKQLYAGECDIHFRSYIINGMHRVQYQKLPAKYHWVGRASVHIDYEISPDLGNGDVFVTYEGLFTSAYDLKNAGNNHDAYKYKEKRYLERQKLATGLNSVNVLAPDYNHVEKEDAAVYLYQLTHIKIEKYIDGVLIVLYEGGLTANDDKITYDANKRFVYIAPLPPETAQVEFACRPNLGPVESLWMEPEALFPNSEKTSGPFALLPSDILAIGYYDYLLRVRDKDGKCLSLTEVSRVPDGYGNQVPRNVSADGLTATGELLISRSKSIVVPHLAEKTDDPKRPIAGPVVPTYTFAYDRWHLTHSTTADNNANAAPSAENDSQYIYDRDRLIAERSPETEIILPEERLFDRPQNPNDPANQQYPWNTPRDLIRRGRPTTTYYHDIYENPLAEGKPSGSIWWNIHNAAGLLIAEYSPTHLIYLRAYDIFSRIFALTDSQRSTTRFFFDKTFQPILISYPKSGTEGYEYNRRGQQIVFIDESSQRWLQQMGILGDVTYTLNPENVWVARAYDRQGNVLMEEFPDGTKNVYTRNWWGLVEGYIDRGGAKYQIVYDALRRVIQQTSKEGDHGNDANGGKVRNQDFRISHYQNGAVFQRYDRAQETLEIFRHTPGNKVKTRRFTSADNAGTIQQDSLILYDELGRKKYFSDKGLQLTFRYDANGNIRVTEIAEANQASALAAINQLAQTAKVNIFDADDNAVISRGYRQTDGHVVYATDKAKDSTHATYDPSSGLRRTLTYLRHYKSGDPQKPEQSNKMDSYWVIEATQYDERKRVWQIDIAALDGKTKRPDIFQTQITLNPALHQVKVLEKKINYGGDTIHVEKIYINRKDGQLDLMIHKEGEPEHLKVVYQVNNYYSVDGWMQSSIHSENDADGKQHATHIYEHTPVLFTDKKVRQTRVTSHVIGETDITSNSSFDCYTPNGGIASHKDDQAPTRWFISDIDNKVYSRTEGQGASLKFSRGFYDGDGNVVALCEQDPSLPGKQNGAWSFDGLNPNALDNYSSLSPFSLTPARSGMTLMQAAMDFFGGDNLEEVVMTLQIANGMISATEPLPPGQTLRLPTGTWQTKLTAQTSRRPDPSLTTNALPVAPPPPLKVEDISIWQKAVPIVVMVGVGAALSVILGPQMMGLSLANIASGAAQGAIIAGSTNAAYQLSAQAVGLPNSSFKWDQFGSAVLTGAIIGGVQPISGSATQAILGKAQITNASMQRVVQSMQYAATATLTTQGIGSIKGSKADLQQVVFAMLVAGVSESTFGNLNPVEAAQLRDSIRTYSVKIAAQLADEFLSQTVMSLLNGEDLRAVDPVAAMAKVAGKTVGTAVGAGVNQYRNRVREAAAPGSQAKNKPENTQTPQEKQAEITEQKAQQHSPASTNGENNGTQTPPPIPEKTPLPAATRRRRPTTKNTKAPTKAKAAPTPPRKQSSVVFREEEALMCTAPQEQRTQFAAQQPIPRPVVQQEDGSLLEYFGEMVNAAKTAVSYAGKLLDISQADLSVNYSGTSGEQSYILAAHKDVQGMQKVIQGGKKVLGKIGGGIEIISGAKEMWDACSPGYTNACIDQASETVVNGVGVAIGSQVGFLRGAVAGGAAGAVLGIPGGPGAMAVTAQIGAVTGGFAGRIQGGYQGGQYAKDHYAKPVANFVKKHFPPNPTTATPASAPGTYKSAPSPQPIYPRTSLRY